MTKKAAHNRRLKARRVFPSFFAAGHFIWLDSQSFLPQKNCTFSYK